MECSKPLLSARGVPGLVPGTGEGGWMRRGPAREYLLVLQAAGMFPLPCWRLSMSSQDCGGRSLGLGVGG